MHRVFILTYVPSANTEQAEFMTYIAASHQGLIHKILDWMVQDAVQKISILFFDWIQNWLNSLN